jgi:hypothetical protein
MKSKIWLIISGAYLISIHLQADESDYGTRQFTINPGNVMDGMFNPMRNMFGGSNRYSDDYYNYRYAPPPPYLPGYGYPGQNPAYQFSPQQGGMYPLYEPRQQAPAPSVSAPPPQAPPASDYIPTAPAEPTYYEQFRFRPLEKSEISTQMPPAETAEVRRDQGILTPQQGYEPSLVIPPETGASQMKFRPLDKPGYSE